MSLIFIEKYSGRGGIMIQSNMGMAFKLNAYVLILGRNYHFKNIKKEQSIGLLLMELRKLHAVIKFLNLKEMNQPIYPKESYIDLRMKKKPN